MKKIIGLLLILFSLALLATAGASPDENGEPNGTQAPETENEAVPTPGGATYTMTVEPMYDSVLVSHFGIAVQERGNWGVVDVNGRELFPFGRYERIGAAGDGLFIVQDGGEVGVVDQNDREVIPLGRYDDIFGGIDGRFSVQLEEQLAVIDVDGREIIAFRFGRYRHIRPMWNDLFFVIAEDFGLSVIDRTGREIISLGGYASVRIQPSEDNFFVVSNSDDEWSVVDVHGRGIIPFGKYGRIAGVSDGRFVVGPSAPPRPEEPEPPLEPPPPLQPGEPRPSPTPRPTPPPPPPEEWRVVDIDGNEIIPFGRYANILLTEGGAAVQCPDTELWGIIRFN